MTWGLVGVGMRSTSWIRLGSPRRHLGICLLGGVFLVVFVRHLFLGELLLFFFFFPLLFVLLFLVWVFLWVLLFLLFYFCCVITVGFCSWVSGSLGSFLVGFLVLGKLSFLVSFVVVSGLYFCIYWFEYTELLPGWLTSEALLTRC